MRPCVLYLSGFVLRKGVEEVMKDILIKYEDCVNCIDDFLAHTKPGKPGETLMEHLQLTIEYYHRLCMDKKMDCIIKNIINKLTIEGQPLEEQWRSLIYKMFVNAIFLHDAGKINPGYQTRVLGNSKILCKRNIPQNHSIYSALIYIAIFSQDIKLVRPGELRNYLFNILYSFAYSISKHHGSLCDIRSFISELHSAQINAEKGVLDYYINTETIYKLDFSDEEKNPFGNKFYEEWNMEAPEFYILNKLLFSLIVTCDYYSTYEYLCESAVNMKYIQQADTWKKSYYEGALFGKILEKKEQVLAAQISALDMNGLRTRIFIDAEGGLQQQAGNNIFYLEAPTGSGKTNTSINLMLRLLEQDPDIKNVFYIFPFNTLVEQTAAVLKTYFKEDVAVVNSITPIAVEEKKNGEDSKADFDTSYLNRLFFHYPLAVTSHINLFNALFGTTRENMYLLPRLCGSVVILDEIQCYKNKIWREIVIMLQKYAQLLNIKIIIMSATLPRLDYMLGEGVEGFGALLGNSSEYFQNEVFKNRVILDTELLKGDKILLKELADFVIQKYKTHRRKCLIEFIKKSTARKFFNLLLERQEELELEKTQIFELTGDDNIFDRKNIIAQIKALENVIVVSTQVIEAGVDIDMDYGFKNISLLDSEEQFLGRINRSCTKSGCKVYFFMADEPEEVYKNDNRIQFTLKDAKMADYLISKNFHEYYKKIMDTIVHNTSRLNTQNIDGFNTKLLCLEYKNVQQHMKLIDNGNVQIFLAYSMEREVEGKKILLDGKHIWRQYKQLCTDISLEYAERQVKLSQLSEVMNFFTYNVTPNQAKSFHDEHFGLYYIENGEDFIENGKFMREKFSEVSEGFFI